MSRTCLSFCAAIAVFALALSGCSDDSPTGPGQSSDRTPPSGVEDVGLALTSGGLGVIVQWTAPSDDSLSETVSAYEILVEYTNGFTPPDFWRTAAPVPDPPEPSEPGTAEAYLIENPRRARDLYVGIVAVDEGGNRSTPAGPVEIHVPGYAFAAQCVDVLTESPVEGLSVTLSTGESFEYTTDAAGRIAHDGELDGGVTYVEVRGGAASAPYHSMSQALVLADDSVHTFFMIPVEPVSAAGFPNLLTLFNVLRETATSAQAVGAIGPDGGFCALPGAGMPVLSDASQILRKWRDRPLRCFIPAFVNANGVDYGAQAKLAAMRWMERTGEALFDLVDSPPDTGIVVTYKPRSEMGITIGITRHTFGDDGALLRDDIWVVDDAGASAAATLYLIFLHEIGHTLPLGHIDDPSFIMYPAQPLPGDISDDEVRVVQLLESLPFGIDMSIYDENSP